MTCRLFSARIQTVLQPDRAQWFFRITERRNSRHTLLVRTWTGRIHRPGTVRQRWSVLCTACMPCRPTLLLSIPHPSFTRSDPLCFMTDQCRLVLAGSAGKEISSLYGGGAVCVRMRAQPATKKLFSPGRTASDVGISARPPPRANFSAAVKGRP